eukprot:TRINITY_DN1414_c0_g1_i1.p2 TRINITY_DN1414_c0_g1~~TRINITY_DN1414_c0_g1_i1.p2  ORF type:complete len:103 (-),score=23.24 TRINITY_DN1414_c0_g1_i1:69-377(-)
MLLRKNAILEELTRRHEDVLHILEFKIKQAESTTTTEASYNALQRENAQLRTEVERLQEELRTISPQFEQLKIQYQIQALEIQRLKVQHSWEQEAKKVPLDQ